jgi:hypothetical protein
MANLAELETLIKRIERLVNESEEVYQELYELSGKPGFKIIRELLDKHQAILSEIARLMNDKIQRRLEED